MRLKGLCWAALILLLSSAAAHGVRLRDLADVEGIRENRWFPAPLHPLFSLAQIEEFAQPQPTGNLGKLDDGDKFNGEFVLLDVWGYPLYYYVEEKTVGAAGVSYTARFGRWNKNGCDLGSRGPDHLPDAWESGGTWGRDAGKNDDVVNWK